MMKAKNTVTTAQFRRITRSTRTTAGFSAMAMNTAMPTHTSTVRTLSSNETAMVNTRIAASTFATVRSGTSSTIRWGESVIATRLAATPIVEVTAPCLGRSSLARSGSTTWWRSGAWWNGAH